MKQAFFGKACFFLKRLVETEDIVLQSSLFLLLGIEILLTFFDTMLISIFFFFRSELHNQWPPILFIVHPPLHGYFLYPRLMMPIFWQKSNGTPIVFISGIPRVMLNGTSLTTKKVTTWAIHRIIILAFSTLYKTVASDSSAIIILLHVLCGWRCSREGRLEAFIFGTAPESKITCAVNPNTDTSTNVNLSESLNTVVGDTVFFSTAGTTFLLVLSRKSLLAKATVSFVSSRKSRLLLIPVFAWLIIDRRS